MRFIDWISMASFGCWGVCFWWMHTISSRQNSVLDQLRDQAQRIEKMAEQEHAILSDLDPNVEKLQQGADEVSEKVVRVEKAANGIELRPHLA